METTLTKEQADLLTFEFKGIDIYNPYESECGRFILDPSYYGFDEHHTGGGCMALVKQLEGGHSLWLTDCDGSGIPESADPEDLDGALYGRYDQDGECVVVTELATLIKFKQQELAGELPDPSPSV
jgi:hypothetical protein